MDYVLGFSVRLSIKFWVSVMDYVLGGLGVKDYPGGCVTFRGIRARVSLRVRSGATKLHFSKSGEDFYFHIRDMGLQFFFFFNFLKYLGW